MRALQLSELYFVLKCNCSTSMGPVCKIFKVLENGGGMQPYHGLSVSSEVPSQMSSLLNI